MDQDSTSPRQTQEDNPNEQAPVPAAVSTADSPARPRRPQRSANVEGSVDIAEAKAEQEDAPSVVSKEEEVTPDGPAASRPKTSRPVGPKGPGHHPVRAASVPHPPVSRPVPPHLNPHAFRALSVAGTADTQAQTVEDFRQVPMAVCLIIHISACLCVFSSVSHSCQSVYLYSLTVQTARLHVCNKLKNHIKIK